MKSAKSRVGRRAVLAGLSGTLVAPAIVSAVSAQNGAYPNKTVRYINPFPPGGATDTLSRMFCAKLAELSGQQWVVENKGGSGGNVGMDALAQSPADGYTLGLGGIASHAISPSLYAKLPFNARTDFTFVSTMWQLPNMLVVNLDVPAKTVAELIELLRKNPGKYSYASAGNGTTLHLSGELFKMMAGVDMVHVPYRGSAPMMTDLVGGQLQIGVDVMVTALPQIRAGKLRAIAVTGAKRFELLPDVPTIAETVPGYEAATWGGVGAPRGTPPEIIARLNRDINAGLANPAIRARLLELGTLPMIATAAEFGAYASAEAEKWSKVVKAAGNKPE